MRITNRWIPFWFLMGACLLMARMGHSFDYWNNRSTNSLNGTTLFCVPNAYPGDMIGSLYINQRSSSPETFKLYDSSAIASNLIGTIDVSSGGAGSGAPGIGQFLYNLRISSGITYTKSGGSSNLTILWQSLRNQ